MQVLNLQYEGSNPEKMKVTWGNPMVGTVVTQPLISGHPKEVTKADLPGTPKNKNGPSNFKVGPRIQL